MELGNHFFATVNGEIVTWRSLLVKILAQVVILVLNYIFSKLVTSRKESAERKQQYKATPHKDCATDASSNFLSDETKAE